VSGALVSLSNAVAGFRRLIKSGNDGGFQFTNVPFHNYELHIEKEGFAADERSVSLRSNIPVVLTVNLQVEQAHATVTVVGDDRELVSPEETGTHNQMNQAEIEKLSVRTGSRGLESVLVSFPGFAQNANGAIHPRGAHNQMTFVIDGMPVSDQLTGAFANAVDPNIVQTVELFTGNVSVEYGSKVSGVAVVTSRSGLGSGRKFSGSTQVGAAQFDTFTEVTQVAGGTDKLGYFASINVAKSNRFLDQVSLDNLQNGGNSERAFTRLDYMAGPKDILRLNLMAGRSSFQLANLRSQHVNLQNQRQMLRDFSASAGWVHTIDAQSTFDATVSYRTTVAQLFNSPGDTPVSASQARHLSTITASGRYNRVIGVHTLRAGADFQRFPVSENFNFAVTSPDFNDPNSEGFNPSLLKFDLSRGGQWFIFGDNRRGSLDTGFVQDNIRWKRLAVALGLRYDNYRFLAEGGQIQPRVGFALHFPESGTVLRASYNRNYQTPPNENLLVASSEKSAVLAPPEVTEATGGYVIIRPERQNVYEVGLQQGVGRRLSLDASYYHKQSTDLQDNDNFFNTGIIFPTSLLKSRVNGAELRVNFLPTKNFSGTLSMTHYHVVVTPPFTGGLFLGSSAIDLLSAGPFIIDHDQTLGVHGVLNYNFTRSLWASLSVRYDSGLVSNPSDPAEVSLDPDYADLLPYVNLESDPPRVRPRTISDLAVGYEKLREGRRLWDVAFQLTNIGNVTALYNFQSIFVGTRLVQPRTAGLRFRVYF
jgi:hypothetical protein